MWATFLSTNNKNTSMSLQEAEDLALPSQRFSLSTSIKGMCTILFSAPTVSITNGSPHHHLCTLTVPLCLLPEGILYVLVLFGHTAKFYLMQNKLQMMQAPEF